MIIRLKITFSIENPMKNKLHEPRRDADFQWLEDQNDHSAADVVIRPKSGGYEVSRSIDGLKPHEK